MRDTASRDIVRLVAVTRGCVSMLRLATLSRPSPQPLPSHHITVPRDRAGNTGGKGVDRER